ncbi:hypothetical protein Q1695_003876 [Nippostrongylus brasiliensis]|nr:hypothetical protein Q1695_003876 [Nippostrongylus brasiliensis]
MEDGSERQCQYVGQQGEWSSGGILDGDTCSSCGRLNIVFAFESSILSLRERLVDMTPRAILDMICFNRSDLSIWFGQVIGSGATKAQ